MKLQIDTEVKEVRIYDSNVRMGDIVDWMIKHLGDDWKEWEIVPKEENNTWPWYPTPMPNPIPPWSPMEPWVTTDGIAKIDINGCNNSKCYCDGSCKENKDIFVNDTDNNVTKIVGGKAVDLWDLYEQV